MSFCMSASFLRFQIKYSKSHSSFALACFVLCRLSSQIKQLFDKGWFRLGAPRAYSSRHRDRHSRRMVLSFTGLPSCKRLLLLVLQCSLCHRAMVSKLWCQKIGRRWKQAARQEPPQARVLSEPKCQLYVANWYLYYRWIIFLTWAAFVVCSIFEFGSYKPLQQYEKWPIYLTNWDMALGLTQALVGGILASKRWRLQKIPGFDPSSLKLESTERLYWFLYVVTTNMAIGVTVCYWLAVYNPKIHEVDPLNIMMHVCNSVLMLIDLFITSIPFRMRNFWWCLSIVLFYLIFSVIYYVAGGLDKYGYHYIYKVLDWKKPVRTLLVCIGGFTFMTVLHCVICMLANIRDRIYRKTAERLSKPAQINVTDNKPLPEKQMEVV